MRSVKVTFPFFNFNLSFFILIFKLYIIPHLPTLYNLLTSSSLNALLYILTSSTKPLWILVLDKMPIFAIIILQMASALPARGKNSKIRQVIA